MANESDVEKPKAVAEQEKFRDMLVRYTIPPSFTNQVTRNERYGLPYKNDAMGDYIVELNLTYYKGMRLAGTDFRALFEKVLGDALGDRKPLFVSKSYFKCSLTMDELNQLVGADQSNIVINEQIIYKVWPDFPVMPLIDHSAATVKADAAVRAYAATGDGIVWAVIDSGIEGTHVHFGGPADGKQVNKFCATLSDASVASLHRDFSAAKGVPQVEDYPHNADALAAALQVNIASALVDGYGHGTHVAGIIAGGLDDKLCADEFNVEQRVYTSVPGAQMHTVTVAPRAAKAGNMRGVAPQARLVSLKVLDQTGRGSTSNIMLALRYIREELNDDPKLLRVHGVNLSVGYEFDAEMFACGQSPLCVEVDRMVKTGVVVVVAAGNTGFAQVQTVERFTKLGLNNTINDPGNAELAITVGSTHRDSPHTYGVSFFSSKGPTGDGRMKPDLVAPGERITSSASNGQLQRLGMAKPPDGSCTYIDDSGTSMAAPHVSGAVAAFLSIRREYIQKPEEIKKIFTETATQLGDRDKYFQGHGLIDLMRAIQSV